MIDIHFHLLAGVDDGPASTADMLALARAAADAGTTEIVATPHFDDVWNLEADEIEVRVEKTRAMLASARMEIRVHAGAEVALSRLLSLAPHEFGWVSLGEGPYLLVESPHTTAAGNFHDILLRLRDEGHQLVLAHPERCPMYQRRPELVAQAVDAGILTSITSGSLKGRFGRTIYGFSLTLLESGLVHNIASDAHHVGRRPPGLLDGIESADRDLPGLRERADYFVTETPAAILAGEVPEPPPALERVKRRRRFARR